MDALELIYGDLCGPITPATNGGRWYFLTSKDEAAEAIKKFKARMEAESGKKLRVLRTDRGGKFTSVEFAAYYVDQGVL